MEPSIIQEFDAGSKKFLATLYDFNIDQFNRVPFENSWTGAQVGEHIFKSQALLPSLLGGKTTITERSPEEKREIVKKIFLDFNTKLESPEFILPKIEQQDQQELIKKLEEKRIEVIHAMESHDLLKTCLDFVLPNLGALTGLEWGWFITYHTQRHAQQLKNILKKLTAP